MRFILKEKKKTKTTRNISKFALLPICIGNEIRWLEKVYIEQVLVVVYDIDNIDDSTQKKWENKRFMN